MDRLELIKATREILTRAGFYTSDLQGIRLAGFDIIARRDEVLLIIKVLSNVDSLTEELADELRILSHLLHAKPLVVGLKNGSGGLEDDVVYYRFGIQSITAATLFSNLLEGVPVHVYAAPGGFYVHLNEQRLRQLRTAQNLSLGTFARHVNISRKAVQMYEDGMNARVDIAIRIEDLLGDLVTRPIDLLSTENIDIPKSTKEQTFEKMKEFQREAMGMLQKMGYDLTLVGRCPFQAVSKEKEQVLLTCVHRYNNRLEDRAQVISHISKITERHAFLITDKQTTKRNIGGTPVVHRKELKKTLHAEDLLDLILNRL